MEDNGLNQQHFLQMLSGGKSKHIHRMSYLLHVRNYIRGIIIIKKLNIESDVTEERLRVSRAPRTCGNEKRRLIDRYINSKIDINQNFFKIELEAFSLNRSSFPTKWRRHGYVGERIAYKQSFFFFRIFF